VRKNAYIVIKNRPCKVVDVSTSKTGKHGHAKCAFVAVDIFTGKKMEDLSPSSHNVDVPHVSRTDYTLLDIGDDGFVSLMTEGGDTKDDLQLPSGTDEAEKLAVLIKQDFDAGKELMVSVMKVGSLLIGGALMGGAPLGHCPLAGGTLGGLCQGWARAGCAVGFSSVC
jgi:translation initiation factor 5A